MAHNKTVAAGTTKIRTLRWVSRLPCHYEGMSGMMVVMQVVHVGQHVFL